MDFESVQPESLASLNHDHFKVMVFLGASQAKVPVDLAMSIQRLGERAEYVQISGNGPNALDFHIAFYIGQLAAIDPTAFFHVISKDKGFDPLIQHLKSRKIFAGRSTDIASIPLVKSSSVKSPHERAVAYVAKLHEPKVTRPRAMKTLSSSVRSFFQNQLSDAEVSEVIEQMRSSGFITITEGRVAYAQKDG
ncbi:PIN domain-containing protein [Pelomonas sp. SE-A7]|uniref:PIN domain-containing protein n=1 Tax=Pelomonas sp. SE-A7 TaxID=3054953 RepID=UPI00259C9069|nr:PIN domain-containing protein [Pelomonas sp. SE-A7]MDM4768548.1 PIN domain-containing protein [Pelomonas sp. SE-A7]